jgi:acyl carrier protein
VTKDEARRRIKALIAETGGLADADFPDTTPLWSDEGESLGFDSIGLLELSMALEEAFQLEANPAEDIDPEELRTVASILNYVAARSRLIDGSDE